MAAFDPNADGRDCARLQDLAELQRFLTGLRNYRGCFVYQGLRIDAEPVGLARVWRALLFNTLCGPLAPMADCCRGLHLRVELPVSPRADLLLRSRGEPRSTSDRLAARFEWSATSDERVRGFFTDALLDLLEQLAAQYRIKLTDQYLQFGPLRGTPEQTAQAVDALVRALPRPEVPDAGVEVSSESSASVANDDGARSAEDQVVIGTTTSRLQADLWRSVLSAAAIPCHCAGYEESPPWGAATPLIDIKVLVERNVAARAQAVLARAIHEEEEGTLFCHNCGETVSPQAQRCGSCDVVFESNDSE